LRCRKNHKKAMALGDKAVEWMEKVSDEQIPADSCR
jgi:hypothetical protein